MYWGNNGHKTLSHTALESKGNSELIELNFFTALTASKMAIISNKKKEES